MTGPRRSRLRLPVALALAGFGVAGLLGLAVLRLGYPGMASGMWNQVRYGTVTESWNLWLCNSYWLEFMAKLRFDPEQDLYNFRLTPDRGLGDFEAGRLAFHRGEFQRARQLLERHLQSAGESEPGLFWLAMTYLRIGERANCLAAPDEPAPAAHRQHAAPGLVGLAAPPAHDHPLFCSLPLVALHRDQGPSRQAARTFERLLERSGTSASNRRLYQWLLNFSYMTVGGFPREVPARYRIDSPFIDTFYGDKARRTAAELGHLRFTDRARELGIDNFGSGRGVAVEDFDNDGDLDVATTGAENSVRFFRNEAGVRFRDVTGETGLGGIRQPFTVLAADYDNDGWMDLFVARPFTHYRLYRNLGGGTFADVTAATGLLALKPRGAVAASWISAFGDVDNDGDLDLFIANWAFKMPFVSGVMAQPRMDSVLALNERGHFRDGSRDLGLTALLHDRYFIGSAFGDYDGDGWTDLFLSSPLRGTSVLLHNQQSPDGRGRRLVPTDAYPRNEPGFAAAFLDADQDGRLDLFHAGFGDARTSTMQTVFRHNADRFATGHSAVLLQAADGRFVERADLFDGADMPQATMGSSFGDLDNDGCFDFYLGTGNPEPWYVLPNLMYLGEMKDGKCTGRLRNISMLAGFGTIQKGHGIVFFDFDNDGDQDVFSALGGMWPADRWTSQLFVNESAIGDAWVKVRLRGRRTNRFGVGAAIKVTGRTADGREVVRHRRIDGGTGFGSAPYLAHVGLPGAVAVESIEVDWPVSRCRHAYPGQLRTLVVADEAACRQDG